MLHQIIGQNAFNTVLDVAVAAEPNTWVVYAIVATALLAPGPAALVLLILLFGTQNPNLAIKIFGMMRCNYVFMDVMGRRSLLRNSIMGSNF